MEICTESMGSVIPKALSSQSPTSGFLSCLESVVKKTNSYAVSDCRM